MTLDELRTAIDDMNYNGYDGKQLVYVRNKNGELLPINGFSIEQEKDFSFKIYID